MVSDGLAKETLGCSGNPLSRQQKVDSLACRIDCPVQIFPLAIGFVHSPEPSYGTFMPTKGLIQKWYYANDPTVKCGMIYDMPLSPQDFAG